MRKTPTKSIRSLVSTSLFLAASTLAQDIPFYDGAPNFMFIGNSYTQSNCLSSCVFVGILEDGIPEWGDNFRRSGINPAGHSLGSNLALMETEGTGAGKTLAGQLIHNPVDLKWAVLQDQSQMAGFHQWDWEGTGYYASLQAAIKFNEYIEAAGGQTMFYMTWGRRDGDRHNPDYYPDFLTMQDKLEIGYKRYREATSTPSRPTYIAPCGLVFKTIYMDHLNADIDPLGEDTLFRSLYINDGSHPSIRGTYLTALTIYTSMTGKNPRDINWFPDDLDEATGRQIQDAVSRTILQTFNDKEIDYPWTQAFPARTSPPVTGSITITFQYDEYPEEISWTLVEEGAPDALFFQPFESDIAPEATVPRTFNNLEAGRTYEFRARDSENDGICCNYGNGSITIYDDVQGIPLLHTDTEFTQYFEVFIKVLRTGRAQWVHRSADYQPGTWEDMEVMVAPDFEGGWPGAFPTQPSSSLMINMDVDSYPEELSWILYHQNDNRQWETVNTWDGTTATAGALDSTEFAALQQGWYRFIVTDSAHDGLCCDYGRGYVSITGPLGSADGAMGLVWGNNGQFMREEEIFFRVSERGFISQISWVEVP